MIIRSLEAFRCKLYKATVFEGDIPILRDLINHCRAHTFSSTLSKLKDLNVTEDIHGQSFNDLGVFLICEVYTWTIAEQISLTLNLNDP